MSARVLALLALLPVAVSVYGLAASSFNRAGGREPITLSYRELSLIPNGEGRLAVAIAWSSDAVVRSQRRQPLSRRTYVALTIDPSRGQGSRLVKVADDPDPDVLARQYPDGRTHLITAATLSEDGHVTGIDPRVIVLPAALVPDDLAQLLGVPRPRPPFDTPAFSVDIRYGRRWEPQVVALRIAD